MCLQEMSQDNYSTRPTSKVFLSSVWFLSLDFNLSNTFFFPTFINIYFDTLGSYDTGLETEEIIFHNRLQLRLHQGPCPIFFSEVEFEPTPRFL